MRINIWVPDEKLKEIDNLRGNKSRSEYLVSCAIKDMPTNDVYTHTQVNNQENTFLLEKEIKEQLKETCEIPTQNGKKCYSPVIGKFYMSRTNNDGFTEENEKYLCQYHFNQISKNYQEVEKING